MRLRGKAATDNSRSIGWTASDGLGGIWAKFISKPEDENQKNRYAGFDY